MLQEYSDLHRIARGVPPVWFDESGVPRWCEFSPWELNNVYADEAALLLVACQGCGREYRVAVSWVDLRGLIDDLPPLSERVKEIHYGDPPCFACMSGRTMNCIDLQVLEFWRRDRSEWLRRPNLEISLNGEEGLRLCTSAEY